MNLRFGNGIYFTDQFIDKDKIEFELDQRILEQPLHWKKPRIVATQWLGDLFHEQIPYELINKVFAVIRLAPHHKFLILTKRPRRMQEFLTTSGYADWGERRDDIAGECFEMQFEDKRSGLNRFTDNEMMIQPDEWPLSNVWLGVSICTQKEADEKIPILLQTSAAHRFVNLEPMLENIWLPASSISKLSTGGITSNGGYSPGKYLKTIIDWVLLGCESGPGRRPLKMEWAESIIRQCKAAEVPLFIKQLDIKGKVEKDLSKFPNDLKIRVHPIWK